MTHSSRIKFLYKRTFFKSILCACVVIGSTFAPLQAHDHKKDNPESNIKDVIRLSQPVSENENTETFGDNMDLSLPKTSLKELVAKAEEHLDKPMLIQTKVAKVCQKKGCFFIAQQNDMFLRVSFKDYEFFIPTDSGNKEVLLNGKLISKNLTDEQAAHFNSDLKMDSVLKPGDVYEIVASSIRIPRS